MIKHNAHIVFLVLFQLLVFAAPHIIKATHRHSAEQCSNHPAGIGKTFSHTSKGCPICKFEFVTSIAKEEIRVSLFQQATPIINTELAHQAFKACFSSCLLRGPPIS